MKRLLLILILTLSFQTLSKADDIRKFQIEGMSIGDSLLDFFSEGEILKNTDKNMWKGSDKKFTAFLTHYPTNLKTYAVYDYLRVEYLTNDNNFIIHGITGMKDYKKINIQECYKLQKIIEKEFDKKFSNFNKSKKSFASMYDKTGESKITSIYYDSKNGYAETSCYHFSSHVNYPSGIDISLTSGNLKKWISSLRDN